ncbi:hypothetical protein ES708_06494 [subsurface metagenome]
MKRTLSGLILFASLAIFPITLYPQSSYEIRKLTEDEWLEMSTPERMNALSTSLKHEENQTFIGDFGRDYDLYKKWGYEYYEMEDRYESYAFRGFENYNIVENKRRRWSYNEFGDRIERMGGTGRIWWENYGGDGTFNVSNPGDYINLKIHTSIDGIWIAKESTDDWSVSAVGSGSLRAKYTPLTLSIPNINGMKVDFQSSKTDVSFLNSQVKSGILLRAGQFRRKIGILTVGATYANMYGYQGNREGGRNWFGTVSNYEETPLVLALRFSDDSPDDNRGGPVIHRVRLKINGRYRDDIIPTVILDDLLREKSTAIIKQANMKYLDPSFSASAGQSLEFQNLKLNETMPKYADYFYFNDYYKGRNLHFDKNFDINTAQSYYQVIEQANQPLQVNGTQCAVYLFDIAPITEKINRAEAVFTVANDYHVQSSMIYTSDVNGGHDISGKKDQDISY